MRARRLLLATLIAALAATPVAAQGRGNSFGHAKWTAPSSAASNLSSQSSTAQSAGASREFGAWLDDASLVEPGYGWTTLSAGYSRSMSGHQFDFPVVDAGVGLNRRTQFGATVPYYRIHFVDGTVGAGIGDVYLNVKYSVIDSTRSRNHVGIAVAPLVEVLSSPNPKSGGRIFLALPASVEIRTSQFRVYGSAGYFTRGAVFASGAVEVPLSARLTMTGGLVDMRSLGDDATADALGLVKTRVDLTAALAASISPSLALFGSFGRTISAAGPLGTSLMMNGGVSITFAGFSK
jgi:hypothetical protein